VRAKQAAVTSSGLAHIRLLAMTALADSLCVALICLAVGVKMCITLTVGIAMKKLKNEKELVRKAIELGMAYGVKRGVVEFEPTDSADERLLYIYRLLVHDKILQPLPEEQVSQKAVRHRLALWAARYEE
jgi:hypothetical protein